MSGLWYLSASLTIVRVTDSPIAIGNAVLDALNQSITGLALPPDELDLNKTMTEIFKAAGVPSRERFLAESVHLSIGRGTTNIELWPTHNAGINDEAGFHFLPEHVQWLDCKISSESLAEAVIRGFSFCTTVY